MRKFVALAAALVVALAAGCGGDSDPEVVADTPPELTAEPSVEPTPDALVACEALFGDGGEGTLMWRVPDELASIRADLDAARAQDLAGIAGELDDVIAMAPAEIAVHLRALQLPFQQVADALAGGGGGVTLETGSASDAIPALVTACGDAGFVVTTEEPAEDGADPVLRRVLEETGGDADAFADLLEEVVRFQAGLSVDLSYVAEAGELADFCADVDAIGVEEAAAEYEADYEAEGGSWTSAHEAGAAKSMTTFCENQP